MQAPDAARRGGFKKGVDLDKSKQRRNENIVAARFEKRDQNLQKKRNVVMGGSMAQADSNSKYPTSRNLEDLQFNVRLLASTNDEELIAGTSYFRKLLSIEREPPIEQVIQQPGVIARFVELLQRDDNDKLQFEASWALTNVASGNTNQTRFVIDSGAVAAFVRLLQSPHEEVCEQAVWALGNIAGDQPETRNLVLGANALPPLLMLLRPEAQRSASMMRNATWTLSNFCRGKPQPPFELTRTALPTLKRLIMSADDEEVVIDSCWALSYLSDGTNDRIQAVIHAGVCRRLVELLRHDKPGVLVPALRTVGNIVTGSDEQTQTIINCHVLPELHALLANAHINKKSITKEACWTISNITAGTKAQIDAVIASGCIQPLVHLLSAGELEIKREAAWAISNATSGGDLQQIQQLVDMGCIRPLCDLLKSVDNKVVMVALEGLKNVLAAGEKIKAMPGSDGVNPFCLHVEDAGGLDHVEALQNHTQPNICEKALEILTSFFDVLPDEENMVPGVDDAGTYNFHAEAALAQTGYNFSGV